MLCKKTMTTSQVLSHYRFNHVDFYTPPPKLHDRKKDNKCSYCGDIRTSINAAAQHELYCKLNPNARKKLPTYNKTIASRQDFPPVACEFCAKLYAARSSYKNHVRRCPSNPNRIHESKNLSAESRRKISEANKLNSQKKWSNPETIRRHKESMRRAVLENPESYTSKNRGRTKQIEYDGLKFQGHWELDFYKWCKAFSVEIERNEKGFAYEWNGHRTYFPDFYMPAMNVYVEVKGYETDRDRAKWSQFPEKLVIIRKQQIKEIRENCFAGIDF